MPLTSLTQCLGDFVVEVARRYGRLKPVTKAGARFDLADATAQWLEQNRLERMDATVELFDATRREFHLDRYRFAAARVQGKEVLDCACGTGYGVRLLCERGIASRVVGADISPAAVDYARQHHGVGSADYLCASADRLPLADDSVDVVTSFETIEHVPDDLRLIEEFHRVLRPNGQLIVSTPNQWPLKDTPFHVREYDRNSFVAALESRFNCLEIYNQNSGSDTPLNHGQARGIIETTPENQEIAECFIAICQRKSFLDDEAESR